MTGPYVEYTERDRTRVRAIITRHRFSELKPTKQLWCTECCQEVDEAVSHLTLTPDEGFRDVDYHQVRWASGSRKWGHFCGPVITSEVSIQEQFIQWCYPALKAS